MDCGAPTKRRKSSGSGKVVRRPEKVVCEELGAICKLDARTAVEVAGYMLDMLDSQGHPHVDETNGFGLQHA